MAASDSLRITPLAVRSLAFGDVEAGFIAIGTATEDSTRMLFVQNLSDQILMFSQDGIDDHFPLVANGFLLMDVMSNRSNSAQGAYIPANTTYFVRHLGVAPTTGTVFVTYWVGQER